MSRVPVERYTVPYGVRGQAAPVSPRSLPTTDAEARALPAASRWERAGEVFDRWGALALLALGTALTVPRPDLDAGDRVGILAVGAVATLWLLLLDVRASDAVRRRRWYPPVFLTGELVLAALLMRHDPIFFVYGLIGFFHAGRLRPKSLIYLGVASTSIVINLFTWGGFPRPTTEETLGFLLLVAVQTVLIGSGLLGGERMLELSEERRRTVHRLETTLAENERLHARLVTQARDAGVQDERQRLAREIHDTLAQGFTGIITQLGAAEQAGSDAALHGHIDTAMDLARHSLAEARRSVQALGPGALDGGRLVDAIHDLARRWTDTYGVEVEVSSHGRHADLPAPVEVALLGVVQEALNNTARHAGANRVAVALSALDDRVLLDVRDDGCGFDAAIASGDIGYEGYGLVTMRQRVREVRGRFTVETRPGAGTAVSVDVPIGEGP